MKEQLRISINENINIGPVKNIENKNVKQAQLGKYQNKSNGK
jgi:hypothetical protein